MSLDDLLEKLSSGNYEQAILGKLISQRGFIEEYEPFLKEEYFYYDTHKDILKTILNLYKQEKPTDIFTVIEALKEQNILDEIGGAAYILGMQDHLPSKELFDNYFKALEELAYKRRVLEGAEKLIEDIADNKLIDNALEEFKTVTELPTASDGYEDCNMDVVMQEFYEEVDNPEIEKKYKTGIEIIDKCTNGLAKGELISIGAASGVGKSALSLKIAMNIYENSLKDDEEIKILIISREMASKEFAKRIVSSKTGINKLKFENKQFSPDDWERMINTITLYSSKNMRIDTKSKTIYDIKRHVKKFKPDILIVDYVQLITPTDSKESRERQVANISRELKNFTIDYDMTVIQLSQLADKGHNYRPHGETYMRESRAVFHDANIVIYIHRPCEEKELNEIYKSTGFRERQSFEEFKETVDNMNQREMMLTEIIIDKNRGGGTGKRAYWFEGSSLTYYAI